MAENTLADEFFDILLVGRTNTGKTTTADILLTANPKSLNYEEEHTAPAVINDGEAVCAEDLTMWLLHSRDDEVERATTRLKNLTFFRKLENSATEIHGAHKSLTGVYSPFEDGSSEPELISNDCTKVRVLDIPGFGSHHLLESLDPSQSTPFHNLALSNLGIIKKICRIQALANLSFSRILYFLPGRGPLEKRPDTSFIQELQLLHHFFGYSVFDSLVVIATYTPRKSKKDSFDDIDAVETLENFQHSFQVAFPDQTKPNPPVIFISLEHTCEEVWQMIKDAKVVNNKLTLKFSNKTCTKCAATIATLDGKKEMACAYGKNHESVIPYEESKCHPKMKMKHSRVKRFFATMGKKKPAWVDDEVCVICQKGAAAGCTDINSTVEYKGQTLTVQHTCEVFAAVEDEAEEDRADVVVEAS